MELIANPSFRYEDVDGEMLVCDPASGLVLRLSGDEATVVRTLLEGNTSVEHHAAVDRLAEAGVVIEMTPTESLSGLSRRRMIQLSAVTAAAAGLIIALPSAAAAASAAGSPFNPPPGGVPPLDPGGQPDEANTAVFTIPGNPTSPVAVFWGTGSGSVFTYRWVVYDETNNVLKTDTTESGRFEATGVNLPTAKFVRFWVGNVVFEIAL